MFDFLLHEHIPMKSLIDYRARSLDNNSREMLEAHLLLCPTCQIQLEDLLPTATSISRQSALSFDRSEGAP